MRKLIYYFILYLVLFSVPVLSVQASAIPISKFALSSLYQGDEEDDDDFYIPDWIEDNQSAMQYFADNNIAQMFVLYPGEMPYEGEVEGSWGDEEAKLIMEHMDYISVIKWLKTRDELRKEYQDFLQEVTARYEEGVLGPDARFKEYYIELDRITMRMWDLWSAWNAEYEVEYNHKHYEYEGFWGLAYQYSDLQDNNCQTGAGSSHLREGYDDLGFITYRDRAVTGYSITIGRSADEEKEYSPQAWALYGYYSKDGNFPGDHDSPEWKLIDARNDFNFPQGDSVTVTFDAAYPGIYNRFKLRLFVRDEDRNDPYAHVGFSEFRFIDGEVNLTEETEIPDPVLPKFTVLHNEDEVGSYYTPRIEVKTDVDTPNSSLRFTTRRVNAVFRHVNPDVRDFTYKWYTPLEFDEDGQLTVILRDSKGWKIFFSDEIEGFDILPGHVCDVILSVDVIEKATGRLYTLCDTIPYYIKYPAPTITQEGSSHLHSAETRVIQATSLIGGNIDINGGLKIDVEVKDYSSGTYATRNLSFTCEPWEIEKEEDENGESFYYASVPGCPWLRAYISSNDNIRSLRVMLDMTVGEGEPASMIVTATNIIGNSSASATTTYPYTRIKPDEGFAATFTTGRVNISAPRDISEWTSTNTAERDAVIAAFKAKDSKALREAFRAYDESRYRTINISAPAEWGPCYVLEKHSGSTYQIKDKVYIKFSTYGTDERSIDFNWPKVGLEKAYQLQLRNELLPDNLFLLTPIVEGGEGDRSITCYFKTEKTDVTTTVVGKFGEDAEEPDYIFIESNDEYIPQRPWLSRYPALCFRDNATQSAAYFNMNGAWSNHALSTFLSTPIRPLGDQHITGSGISSYGFTNRENKPYVNTFQISQNPTIRLQIMDEAGSPITSDVVVTTAFIVEDAGTDKMHLGTSSEFSAIQKGISYDISKAINGILELEIPREEGKDYHVLIEIHDNARDKRYNDRFISEFTSPDIFENYINKGLTYPCVLSPYRKTGKYVYNIFGTWVRPTESHFLGDECEYVPLAEGTELGYEGGGKSNIDILFAGLSSGLYSGEYITLADGVSQERSWEYSPAIKLFAPRLAYAEESYPVYPYKYKGVFNNDYINDFTMLRDDYGRDICWPTSTTGFYWPYLFMTCKPTSVIPDMRKGQTTPIPEKIAMQGFDRNQLDENGKILNTFDINANNAVTYSYWHKDELGYAVRCMNGIYPYELTTAYNTAVEEINPEDYVNSMTDFMAPGYDGSGVKGDKDTEKINHGLSDFEFDTPSCLPFVNLAVSRTDGEYRIRSSFEVNAMDFVMPQNEALEKIQQMQTRINDVSKFTQQFLNIKNSCLGDYTTDIFDQDDGIFVGFKGFLECAVIKDYQANMWKPYFTGFGAKLEASAQYTWKMQAPPFIAKMMTRGEISSTFMLLNPHPKDFALQQAALSPSQGINLDTFNPYSHFNIYTNSCFDLQLCLQAGIGFDAGFIAAHGGLMGKARAAANFSYVNRPYLSGSLKQTGGAKFDLSASLSAYAYFKFLFLKYSKEWPICHVDKTYYWPDNNSNPWKSDPNLNPALAESNAKVRIRPLTATYVPNRKKVSVVDTRTISNNVDIFANPIYMNGGDRLAFFHLGNPADANDDRVFVSGTGCNVNDPVTLYNDNVPAFTYHAASADEHQIVAVQRLAQRLTDKDNDMDAAAELTNKLQIVASVSDDSGNFIPTIISTTGSANTDPRAAIAQNGSAAVVWASGDINVIEHNDGEGGTYSEPCLTGNLMMSQYKVDEYGYGTWTRPTAIVGTSPDSQVKDYAIATGGGRPIVMASIPSIAEDGTTSAPTYLLTANELGISRRTSLGIEGAQHQLVAVYENGAKTTNHFIASSLINVGDEGKTDIQLFDITIDANGSFRHSSLGKLGLDNYKILSYRLVSPKNGATGVDGLGIIWNQHEQENTDDETLDAVAYNRTYVARINRRNNYIYLSHSAQALNLNDDETVADMTAYMDYDDTRDCPIVTAAFCVGETQVDGASTAAYIIEKKVSLNNEIQWLQDFTGLSDIIDKKNGTEIKLGVRNIGLHTIKKFTVEMAGQTFEQTANVAPSDRTTITVKLPSSTNFDNDIPFTITADFYDIDVTDPYDNGVSTGASSVNGSFKINVVDMCTSLTLNRLDKEAKKNVVAISISNLSPMALKAGNSVKVSLFTDALGDTQYENVATYTIPANLLYNAEQHRGLVNTVHFFVNAPAKRTTVYAICQTVDKDGNVVFDQNSSNNMTMVSLAPSNFGDEEIVPDNAAPTIATLVRLISSLKNDNVSADQDYNGDGIVTVDDVKALTGIILEASSDRLTVSDLMNPQLKVRNIGDSIEIEGMNPDKDLKVFDATGQLINWTEPNAENASVKLNRKGTVIVVNDGKAGVIRH